MMNFLVENGLAIYGAVTGTLALGISYFGYRHNVDKSKIKLAVDFSPHPRQAENLKRLRAPKNKEQPWIASDALDLAEYYAVTVRNIGDIPAPIMDVGIISKDGVKHPALVAGKGNALLLRDISMKKVEPLQPKSCEIFNVYLRRGQYEFQAKNAYVVDQTGRLWRTRAKNIFISQLLSRLS